MPLAIRCGIGYSEFWSSTPGIIRVYQKEKEKLQEEEFEKINYVAWLNGVYVLNAVGTLLDKNSRYPDKPFDFKGKANEEDENTQSLDATYFAEWASAFNRKNEK